MTEHEFHDRGETRHPLPALDALRAFRDLGVDENESHRLLACDPSFNRYTAYWVFGETLDAGYVALEGMRRSSEERFDAAFDTIRGPLTAFTAHHFDIETGRFSTNSSERTRGIFAAHTAIGLLRLLVGRSLQEPLTRQGFEAGIKVLGGSPAGARASLDDLIADSRQGDGIVENPAKPLIPSLTAIYTTSAMLRHLEEEGGPNLHRFIERRRLERFIEGCLKRQRVGERRIAGFTIHPDHQELCVNTTNFGLRLMNSLGMELEAPLRAEIENFLLLSYRVGGFSSTLWEPASLNATFFGLKALQIVTEAQPGHWLDFVTRERTAIRSFTNSCVEPVSGGARFAQDRLRYRENCLATRYQIQILELLGARDDDAMDASFDFLLRQFCERSGGFRSYPADQVDADDLDLEDLEHFLDAKDEHLLAQHRMRLDDPARRQSFKPDSRMLELYDRLADLEHEKRQVSAADAAEIDDKIEDVWRELRSRQKSEADHFEAEFDATVLEPLRERKRQLDDLEARLGE